MNAHPFKFMEIVCDRFGRIVGQERISYTGLRHIFQKPDGERKNIAPHIDGSVHVQCYMFDLGEFLL